MPNQMKTRKIPSPLWCIALVFLLGTLGSFVASVIYRTNASLTSLLGLTGTVCLGLFFTVAFRADKGRF